jgi:hypothetical protein
MWKCLLLFIWFVPLWCTAQSTISGKVINLYDKKPIVKASVFLSNTTVGGTTAEDGSYQLTPVKPGQYDMVVSAIGYETAYKTVKIDKDLIIPYTELTPRTVDLKAVVVKPDLNWQQNYNMFKREIFGESEFAEQCKILNPEVLNLAYDKKSRVLTASSNDYLEVDNKALGYKIKYYLTDFIKDYPAGSLYYQGNVLFSPMQGKPAQMRKWYRNRREAFLGSSEHYFRSIIRKRLNEEGFKTYTLVRKRNPARPPDSVIQAKLSAIRVAMLRKGDRIAMDKNDSLNYWSEKNRLPKMVEFLNTKPVNIDSIIKRTDQTGIYAISYKDVLYIVYTKKKGDDSYSNRPLNAPDYPTSLINFKEPYAFFDNNGVIANPTSIIYEGKWATNRLAKLLPVDYDPKDVYVKK